MQTTFNMIRQRGMFLVLFLSLFSAAYAQQPDIKETFTNPIDIGADPWIVKHNEFYYRCEVNAANSAILVSKSNSPVRTGEKVKVWSASNGKWNGTSVWAPELHHINGKWYIYYAAGLSGPPFIHQRSGVLESVTSDPQGAYIEKAVLKTGDDPGDPLKTIWAIDVTVTDIDNQLYAIWSGWEKNVNTDKTAQHLYIAKMSNPWTIDGERVKISSPEQAWETGGPLNLNEGPQVLKKNGNLFIVYSTRESWLPSYRLGLLRLKDTGKSPLDPSNWLKKGPVFTGTDKVYGVGHASFTTSPDGTEDWILYHSKKNDTPGWDRDVRLQKFTWDANGEPLFGEPIPVDVPIAVPSSNKLVTNGTSNISDFNALKERFSTTVEGKPVALYVLKNKNNAQVAITNYGSRLVGLLIPDKNGELKDVIPGFKSIEEYLHPEAAFFGPVIGRFANRVNKGQFVLDGVTYQIPLNDGVNALHGGKKGFFTKVWDASQPNEQTLVLKYKSPDGEEGFPGTLDVTLTYSFNDKNELKLEYEATTDKKTVINLTNHAYFNLNGEGSGGIENHRLLIRAKKYTPVNTTLIPSGTLTRVKGTPFDFRKPQEIGSRINVEDDQLKKGKGYDHNFVLKRRETDQLKYAATLQGDISGIKMNVYTTEPGLQFYSGNFFRGKSTLKSGAKDSYRSALALETQHFPDSPNHPTFPSTILNPGEKFHSVSIYEFSTK
jgi:aldose 1-epimerase